MPSVAGTPTLTLTVIRRAGTAPAQPLSAAFDVHGGTIGRRPGNDWVLEDPERFISGQHAIISYQDGKFYLTDTSINGVFLNHATSAIGKGSRVALQSDDILNIGEYEISVSIQQPQLTAVEPDEFEDPFARLKQEEPAQDLAQALPEELPMPEEQPGLTQQADYAIPLETPESPIAPPETAPFDLGGIPQAAESDHVSELDEVFPETTPIPEDWDLDTDFNQTDTPAVAPLQIPDEPFLPDELTPETEQPLPTEPGPAPAVAKESIPRPGYRAGIPPSASTAAVKPEPSQDRSGSDEQGLRSALARGLGIPEDSFAATPLNELLENLGQVVRFSTEGTMAILRARTEMKGEFRMSQTMIRPVENNPLKFSINTQEALNHLINPQQGSGYLSPLSAIQEAQKDIEAHMLAVMVGMQAALKMVLKRFQPVTLEQRLGKSAIIRNVPLYKHAKTWDLFKELYSEIADEAEDDFHLLFGETFAKAYEEQIRRLASLNEKPFE